MFDAMTIENNSSSFRRPRWHEIDEAWYLRQHPEIMEAIGTEEIPDIVAYFEKIGQGYGHSPNRYFDELWYRQTYPEVQREILRGHYRSGFEHYCQTGYRDHSPHWLFSEQEYRRRYPELTQVLFDREGFLNGYDHYLQLGLSQGRIGHRFFDPELAWMMSEKYPEYFDGAEGVFGSYIDLPATLPDAERVSWYFDPVWYLQRYPEVALEIAQGRYRSALHHYLTNPSPRQYDPQEHFSEAHYQHAHADVMPSIEQGIFRNGYEHFLRFGEREGRSPADGIDLVKYMSRPRVRADVQHGLYAGPFAHWIATRLHHPEMLEEASMPSEAQTRALFLREAEALLPLLARQGLDFSHQGLPEISVIMVVHDQIALTLQALASLRGNYSGEIELLLVDSGSHDQTAEIEKIVKGAHILRFRHNIGYLDGCNKALARASAPVALYLNNDLRLYPHAIANAVTRLHAEPDIGAVGAKLVRTNMRLQEAGSIIWRDGATYGYRREDDPNIAEANFVRDVDYCSAAFLMARTDILKDLGGFDTIYRPAYFEDADLCLRIVRSGARIVYDPSVMVEHLEFGSSGALRSQAMIRANHRIFARQHQDYLRQQQPAHVRNAVLAREHRDGRKKILVIEDRLPLRSLGSGYVRSNDIIRTMARLGYQVTVFPVLSRETTLVERSRDFPESVELIDTRDLSHFADFIQERAGYYDLVWVGRTHNMARLLPIMNETSRYLPVDGTILDTEVVAAPRSLERAEVLGLNPPSGSLEELLREELECARYCRRVVAVSDHDASLIRRVDYENVSVLGHSLRPRPTARAFAERHDLLFVGALHDEESPNYDSLLWLLRDVMPILDPLLPPDIVLTVAGYVHPSVDVSIFAHYPRVNLVGALKDLTPLYDRHRIFVAPTRFAGGLPYKIHEAASFGLPVVATELLAEEVGWENGQQIMSASSRDPAAFAQAIARLYHDKALWSRVRQGALEEIGRDCSPKRFENSLEEILQNCLVP